MKTPDMMIIVEPSWLTAGIPAAITNAYRTILVGFASPITARATVFLHAAELTPEQLQDWKQCFIDADIVVDYGTEHPFDRKAVEQQLHDSFPAADIYCYGDSESNSLNPWLRISAAVPHRLAPLAVPAPELAVA